MIRSRPLQDGLYLKGTEDTGPIALSVPADTTNGPPARFIWHALSRGQVVAITDEHLLADSNFNWQWLLNSLGRSHWQWVERHGQALAPDSLEANQATFWGLLIPGVGLTPWCWAFRFSSAYFAILIGPVNYWLLRRWERLNLLLITVPASALLFTACYWAMAMPSSTTAWGAVAVEVPLLPNWTSAAVKRSAGRGCRITPDSLPRAG